MIRKGGIRVAAWFGQAMCRLPFFSFARLHLQPIARFAVAAVHLSGFGCR
jgi:hypothetical protein